MRFIGSLTLLASLWACQSYVAVPVQPVTLVAVSQRNRVRVFTKADVLLVIDDSFSMSGKQQRLAAALQSFTDDLDALKPPVDYQVAVTTTTVSERLGACGPAGDANAAARCDSEWEAAGFSCDPGLACFRSFPKAGQLNQGSAAPAPVLRRSDYTAQDFARYLASSVQVGVNGARQPQGMEAMKLALQQSGFLRDGSKIVVAFFTDAEDCSDPGHRLAMLVKDPKTGNIVDQCAIMARGGAPSALEPVASYVNYLRGLKDSDGTPKEVEIGAVVSLQDGTLDPGVCANPACDAACDAPPAVAACDSRCKNSPTYQICMADCASECHTFCGGPPLPRAGIRVLRHRGQRLQRRREPIALPALVGDRHPRAGPPPGPALVARGAGGAAGAGRAGLRMRRGAGVRHRLDRRRARRPFRGELPASAQRHLGPAIPHEPLKHVS